MQYRPLLAWLLIPPLAAIAADKPPAEITGEVVGVYDGDTITLHAAGEKHTIKIRLDGIDAPEIGQPFGKQAKRALASKVLAKQVRVETHGLDKYGRTIGTVWRPDGDIEHSINHELVAEGWAWQYLKYSRSAELAEAQAKAMDAGLGLWADAAEPIAPWEWRATEKARKQPAAAAAPRAPREPRKANRPIAIAAEAPSEPIAENRGDKKPAAESDELTHWITIKSGKRHNSGCRYFQNSNGRKCTSNDGIACKICGG